MATSLYKVGWDSLALPGWSPIPKQSYFSTLDGANRFADTLLQASKVNVYIAPPNAS